MTCVWHGHTCFPFSVSLKLNSCRKYWGQKLTENSLELQKFRTRNLECMGSLLSVYP